MVLVNAAGLPITSSPAAGKSTAGEPPAGELPAANTPYIRDINEAEFVQAVINTSQQKPVLVDFWAPWCEACKQYTPILEKAIHAEQGRVILVKINVDDNPNIAQQLQIRSLPTTMIFFQGQPIEAVPGVLPPDSLKKLLSDLLKMSGIGSSTEEIQQLLDKAETALADHDYNSAEQHFAALLDLDSKNPAAAAGMLRTLIGKNQPEQAQAFFDTLDEELQQASEIAAAIHGLSLLGGGDNDAINAAQTALSQAPDNPEYAFNLAIAYLEANNKEQAIEQLLEIVRKHPDWRDNTAQHKLLEIFAALGFADPLAKAGRQSLSTLLFS